MGRSPGEGNGYPPQYSYLENSLARGAWWGTIHGVAKRWTQLSHQLFHIKDELFVVNSGDSGMRQGETLSWRRGSLCPGWLQECPSAQCDHPSCLRSSCPTEPVHPPSQRVWPGCRAGRWTPEGSPALHWLLLWPLLLGFCRH